jgi:ribonuclease P protein component
MLPKKNRLIDDYYFRRVKRLGKDYHSSLFKLGVVQRKEEGALPAGRQASRFGFVISKKIDKRAAVRNRIKRLLRESVRQRLEKIPEGFDFVFVVRPNIVGKDYEEVSAEVDRVLSKVSFHRS